jgi:hypothetical protein
LAVWGDAEERRRVLEAVVSAGKPTARTIERVDRAVVEGLEVIGLPRGPVREVRIEDARIGLAGRKEPDCSIALAGDGLRHVVRNRNRPDTAFRTWVHESLHARQPYAVGAWSEYRRFEGYEEGLAEGLARVICREKAGMNPIQVSYDYYVAAYRALALAFETSVERLWRELWQHATGAVRAAFVDVVDAAHRRQSGTALRATERSRLAGQADAIFGTDRLRNRPDESVLVQTWRLAFR